MSMNTNRDDTFFEGELLAEFAPPSPETWAEKIASDLGEDWKERLQWKPEEDLPLRPFYHADDLKDRPTGSPGMRPGWQVRHDLTSTDPSLAQQEAQAALEGGAEALGLPAAALMESTSDSAWLEDVDLRATALHLEGTPEHARRLFAESTRRTTKPHDLRGSLTFDPAVRRLRSDTFDVEPAYQSLASLIQDEAQSSPFRLVTADARPFHQAGAGTVATLAFTIAALSEHFARLTEHGLAAKTVAARTQVMLPVGTHFFVEVACLRAARRLYALLADAYGADSDTRLQVQAETAWRPMTLYDPHLNLLRGATLGAAAAITGGADVLTVRPFDAVRESHGDTVHTARSEDRSSGIRLSLNAQHILREEAHLGRVADPAAGSYYTEVLTDQLAERAWERFQTIEANGGLLQAIHDDAVQDQLAEAWDERQQRLRHRRRVRVGSNHYPNLNEEQASDAPTQNAPFPRETTAFEKVRRATERYAHRQHTERPAAFLLPVGPPRTRSARANFARNALGCAGFRTVDNVGFDSAEEGANASARALESGKAQFIACAAPDDAYSTLLPLLHETLSAEPTPVVVVARPESVPEPVDDLTDAFLFQGMDLLHTLTALQEQLNIPHGVPS